MSTSVDVSVEPMVRIEGVRKSFGDNEVLKGVDLTIARGEVTCIIGPSGSGKSTLLRCINNLESIDAGRVEVAGQLIGYKEDGDRLAELSPRETVAQRSQIGMVFQHFNLFSHLTVLENIMLAPTLVQKRARNEIEEEALRLLQQVGLSDKASSYPRQLSGGQQQRVAIARALAMRPRLMLFDEPTSALDPELVGEVLRVMKQLAEREMTMCVVTHEMGFARDVADEIVFMDGGRIVEQGPPQALLSAPRSGRLRDFLAHVK